MPDEGVTFQTTVATPPAGFIVAYDDVGGKAYQRVKLDLGADGAAAAVTGTVPVSGTVGVSGSVDTELPAAVALATGMANPTAPQVGAHAMVWNGATWDRQTQPLTDTQLRASAIPVDVADRAARLVGVVSGGANVFHVDDNAASLTVDAPVGTPVFSRLSDGAAALAGQKTMALSLPVALASDQSVMPAQAEQRAATLAVTVTAATGVAATLTLPAPGAGLFHYISLIEIELYATAARTGGATPVLVTTTNLPGSPVWDFDTGQAIGTTIRKTIQPATPIKSSVAATATTIVAPIATTGIWRITAYYSTAA